jgi:hypothetical protein
MPSRTIVWSSTTSTLIFGIAHAPNYWDLGNGFSSSSWLGLNISLATYNRYPFSHTKKTGTTPILFSACDLADIESFSIILDT